MHLKVVAAVPVPAAVVVALVAQEMAVVKDQQLKSQYSHYKR